MSTDEDNPGVVAPPPLVYLGAILVGALMERLWRWRLPTGRVGTVAGGVLIVGAILLFVWALREFDRARTSPMPHKPTTAMVTSGPFRFTRNPIYVAFTLVHLGIALWTSSAWLLATIAPALLVIRFGVIAREERYLDRKFGAEYRAYRRDVRRWL